MLNFFTKEDFKQNFSWSFLNFKNINKLCNKFKALKMNLKKKMNNLDLKCIIKWCKSKTKITNLKNKFNLSENNKTIYKKNLSKPFLKD